MASSWTLSANAPIPARAKRGLAALPVAPVTPRRPPAPLAASAAVAAPSFAKQLALGLAIFAAVLAAALPLAFVSEGLGLAAAVGTGSVLIALVARRLVFALLIATLLAVLGAFAATHAIHLSQQAPAQRIRLAALTPSAGGEFRAPAAGVPAALASTRADLGGVPLAGWAFPAALFVLWAAGFAAVALNRTLLRWLRRRLGRQPITFFSTTGRPAAIRS